MHTPIKQHLGATKRILKYAASAVTWSSKKQDIVALSSSEVEYVATGLASRLALWLRKLLKDFLVESMQ
ncbi:hypothetical protein V2J09_018182 [Rumex salicifolius]